MAVAGKVAALSKTIVKNVVGDPRKVNIALTLVPTLASALASASTAADLDGAGRCRPIAAMMSRSASGDRSR